MSYFLATMHWLEGFAVTCMVVGAISLIGGALLYGVTDFVSDLVSSIIKLTRC